MTLSSNISTTADVKRKFLQESSSGGGRVEERDAKDKNALLLPYRQHHHDHEKKLSYYFAGKDHRGGKSKMTSAVHDDASVNIRLAVLHHLMIYNNVWVKSGNIYRKCLIIIMILMYQSILFEMSSQK